MQVILLEKVNKLGQMGDVVDVRAGYARNYLLPQNKALRATKDNVTYFEAQKAAFQKGNEAKKAEAEKLVKKIEGQTVNIIRQASEGGQLYGSVSTRDIADAASTLGVAVSRQMVDINQSFKTLGLFPVSIVLHPEVTVDVTINIARSEDEAAIQKETGRALVAVDEREEAAAAAAAEAAAEAEAVVAEEAAEETKTEEEAA